MQITLARTKRDHFAFKSFTRRNSPKQNKKYWPQYQTLLALVVLPILLHSFDSGEWSGFPAYVISAFVITLIFHHALWWLRAEVTNRWRNKTANASLSVTALLSPHGVVETYTPSNQTITIPWTQVRGLHETTRHFFLPTASGTTLIFPKRYLADANQFGACVWHYGVAAAGAGNFSYVKESAQQRQTENLCNVAALALLFTFGGLTLWNVLSNLNVIAPPPNPSALLNAYVESLPSQAIPAVSLAQTVESHMKADDSAAAIAACQRAIRQSPRSLEPYQKLAEIYLSTHCPEAAWENFQHALRLYPTSPEALAGLASLARPLGQMDEVEHRLHQLIEQNPNYPFLRLQLANLYEAQQKPLKATIAYRQLLANSPGNLGIVVHRHLFQMRLQRAAGWFADDEALRQQLTLQPERFTR